MQQDVEDRKNEIIIEGLEDKIKKLEDSLNEKDSLLHSAEGSLAEARSQNDKLRRWLDEARATLDKISERFDRESRELKAKVEAEAEKNAKLSETVKNLRDKCFGFATQCNGRLKGIFNSFGAASEEITPSIKDIPGALEHIENEVEALDKVITGHGDFCALVASRGTTTTFMKVGCNHVRAVNRPNFGLLSSDLVYILAEAQSIGNRFITQILAKGGRELAGDEARNLLSTL
jgi:flagellar biosynthesis/type III secretory pathway chaperone